MSAQSARRACLAPSRSSTNCPAPAATTWPTDGRCPPRPTGLHPPSAQTSVSLCTSKFCLLRSLSLNLLQYGSAIFLIAFADAGRMSPTKSALMVSWLSYFNLNWASTTKIYQIYQDLPRLTGDIRTIRSLSSSLRLVPTCWRCNTLAMRSWAEETSRRLWQVARMPWYAHDMPCFKAFKAFKAVGQGTSSCRPANAWSAERGKRRRPRCLRCPVQCQVLNINKIQKPHDGSNS